MSKKLLSLKATANDGRTFYFDFYGDPEYLPEWRAAGFEIDEICNTIPLWLPTWIPIRWWCAAQDIFNFKLPWSRS